MSVDLDDLLGIHPDDPIQAAALEQVELDAALFASLRKLRESRSPRLTQADVAKRMDVDQGTVARIESGRRDVRLSTLRAYALALHARVEHNVVDLEASPGVSRARVLPLKKDLRDVHVAPLKSLSFGDFFPTPNEDRSTLDGPMLTSLHIRRVRQ